MSSSSFKNKTRWLSNTATHISIQKSFSFTPGIAASLFPLNYWASGRLLQIWRIGCPLTTSSIFHFWSEVTPLTDSYAQWIKFTIMQQIPDDFAKDSHNNYAPPPKCQADETLIWCTMFEMFLWCHFCLDSQLFERLGEKKSGYLTQEHSVLRMAFTKPGPIVSKSHLLTTI